MNKILLLIITLFLCSRLNSQEAGLLNCYQDNIISISDIKLAGTDYSGLHFLKEILNDKQIVILGESSHGDGMTFEVKAKIIEFLYKEMGYKTIAFEGGGFWEMYYASMNIQKGNDFKTEMRNSWFSLWSMSKQTLPLLNFLESEKEEMKLLGIENQLGNQYSVKLVEILDTLIGNDAFKNIDKLSFKRNYLMYYMSQSIDTSYRDKVNITQLKNDLILIKENLRNIHSEYSEALIQGINNIEGYIEQMTLSRGSYTDQNMGINLRDSLMAENIFWKLKQNPEEKIIVWTANFHAAHNLNLVVYKKDDYFYQSIETLCERLRKRYSGKVYSIAFTSVTGESATIYQEQPYIIDLSKKTWDYQLGKEIQGDFAFVNFEKIKNDSTCINKSFESSILGYHSHKGKWFSVFDGIFFIRKMQRSEIIN